MRHPKERSIRKEYPNRRSMKLSSPFTVLRNVISDIRRMHDFSYKLPPETHDEFWEKECADHPTASTCKTYEE